MRRFIFLFLAITLILPGCISSISSRKSYRLPRESVRKDLGAHSELAMVLSPAKVVQRKLRKKIAGDDGVHPDYAQKFDALIATFDDKYVENILAAVLKDHFTDAEVLAMSDYLAGEADQKAVNSLNEQLIDFKPTPSGPAPVVVQALGPFAKTAVGEKWVRLSPKVQQDFTRTVKTFSIQETRKIIGKDRK
jgi:hypothetical protein